MRAWTSYSLATELNKKLEEVQVATLLTIIGEEAREVFSTFSGWRAEGDEAKINPVLGKFEKYCQPRRKHAIREIPFQPQSTGTRRDIYYDQYRTALLKLAEGC